MHPNAPRRHRFPIGTQYRSGHGKGTRVCTITDQLTTRNAAGEVVRLAYISEHEFMGQRVTDHDVCDTTIARNLVGAKIEDFTS